MGLIKILISAVIIYIATELSKKTNNVFVAAILISIPFVSLITFMWLYIDTKNTQLIASLSREIVFLVIPTIPMFLLLSYMLLKNYNFYLSLFSSLALMLLSYLILSLVSHFLFS
ncbi:MAG: DUF3147 family protein [Rhodobiaceae bacterium]|jgi:hypothetical protein|nr:DUF3147 family protein [Rhodobiaceae bacterium]|tara:strand:- start:483 stop:827 length:345 start_codon:yes stop_codon:yes gene_type:complete